MRSPGGYVPEEVEARPKKVWQQGLAMDLDTLSPRRLDEFDYELPEDRIAQVPVEPRDAARLLVDRGSAPPEHRTVAELPDLATELRDVVGRSEIQPILTSETTAPAGPSRR